MGAEKSKLAKETGYPIAMINKLEARYESVRTARRDKFDAATLHVRMRLDFDMSLVLCRCLDRERKHEVSFSDFVLGFRVLGPGSIRAKARLLFRACDVDLVGFVTPRNVEDVLSTCLKFISLEEISASFARAHQLLGGQAIDVDEFSLMSIEHAAAVAAAEAESLATATAAAADQSAATEEAAVGKEASDEASSTPLSAAAYQSLPVSGGSSGSRRKRKDDGRASGKSSTATAVSPRPLFTTPPLPISKTDASTDEFSELMCQHQIMGNILSAALATGRTMQRTPKLTECVGCLTAQLFAGATETRALEEPEVEQVCRSLLPSVSVPLNVAPALVPTVDQLDKDRERRKEQFKKDELQRQQQQQQQQVPPLPLQQASSVTNASTSVEGVGSSSGLEHIASNDGTGPSSSAPVPSDSTGSGADRRTDDPLLRSAPAPPPPVTNNWKQVIIREKSFIAFCEEHPGLLVSVLAIVRFLVDKVYTVKKHARVIPDYDPYESIYSSTSSPISIDLNNLAKTEREIKKKDHQRELNIQKQRERERLALDRITKEEEKRYGLTSNKKVKK